MSRADGLNSEVCIGSGWYGRGADQSQRMNFDRQIDRLNEGRDLTDGVHVPDRTNVCNYNVINDSSVLLASCMFRSPGAGPFDSNIGACCSDLVSDLKVCFRMWTKLPQCIQEPSGPVQPT